MKVGIIGAGLQAKRRAPAIGSVEGATLAAVASLHRPHAEALAEPYDARVHDSWQELVERNDLDVVFVCTPPSLHREMSMAAMKAGKHVLCEKPLTRTLEEAEAMVQTARETGQILKCGFNHRHHPAIWEAHRRLKAGDLGEPLFARCRYGICGRPGYEKEWRADPEQAAGGQFIEQGTHAMDLFRWFLGDLTEVSCMTSLHYFKEQTLDDGGMALFRAANGATASLHTTLIQWKNLFSFEVFGAEGYIEAEGLGGGYGTETLSIGKRDFTAPFQDHVIQYRGGDRSWAAEWQEMAAAIRENRAPVGDGIDGLEAMRVALTAYEAERKQQTLPILSGGAG